MVQVNNQVSLIGNAVRTPEMKVLANGTKLAHLTLATNTVFKDKMGARQERSAFHDVAFFGRSAERVCALVTKGRLVALDATLGYRSIKAIDTNGVEFNTKQVQLAGQAFQVLGPRPQSDPAAPAEAGTQPLEDHDAFEEEVEVAA
jgi:single-strand DNA-binding protein